MHWLFFEQMGGDISPVNEALSQGEKIQ